MKGSGGGESGGISQDYADTVAMTGENFFEFHSFGAGRFFGSVFRIIRNAEGDFAFGFI